MDQAPVTQKKFRPFLLMGSVLLVFLIGGAGGWFLRLYMTTRALENGSQQLVTILHPANTEQFQFIRPILGYELIGGFAENKKLESTLQQQIKQKTENGDVQSVSVYFRDSKNGHWAGVNEYDSYIPASLLKVPIMIAYYKESEENQDLLSQKFTINDKDTHYSDQDIPPTQGIQANKAYTVDELIRYMIVYSDNNAMHVLFDHVDPKALIEIFSDLGVDPPTTNQQFEISPKIYSLFFRVLRNASVLTDALSEKALKLLSESEFKNGLVAGVPSDITIAHKFGEAVASKPEEPTIYELHDCGIIYLPNHPYVLCVMTRGKNKNALETTIKDMSAAIYESMIKS